MKYKFLCVVMLASTVIGCAASAPKKEVAETPPTNRADAQSAVVDSVSKPLIALSQQDSGNQIAPPDTLSSIQGQLTALQEQVIKLSGNVATILQLSQLSVANGQISDTNKARTASKGTKSPNMGGDSLNDILKKLEDISPSPEAAFGIVSSYTASKQWVLIRYDRYTGDTWLADNSGWNILAETSELEISQYDVHLIRADQDKKGYVASRIDQRSGDTWWLNKRAWVVYQ